MKTFEDYGIYIRPDSVEWQYMNCPQCSGQRRKKKAKCLSVNTKDEYWVCHHCGWKGSLKKGTRYVDPAWNKPEYVKPKLLPETSELPSKVQKWFLNRGITAKTLNRNKITLGKVYMPQVEDTVHAIGFPYYRTDEHINTKWRDHEKNFRLETGAEQILYGLNDILDSKHVIWVEGEIDKLSVEEAGFINCVSCPNGAPSPESKSYSSKFDFLLNTEEYLQDKKHILFVDNDEAGKKLESELARRLGKENCKRVRLPEGYKDANEYLIGQGKDALKDAIYNAQPFPVSGLHTALDFGQGLMRLHDQGLAGGVATGWKSVDHYYTVRQGEWTVVTGIPNHGKSNWLDSLTINIAQKSGWRFAVFSPENQPLERHAAGLAEKLIKKPFKSLEKDEVEAALDWLNKHYYWILPDIDESWSLNSILEKAKVLIFRHGVNGLIIDPWNEIEHSRPSAMTETEYISESLTKIRQFARMHNIHIWVVAHPAKLRKEKDSNEYPVPTPYDISGSAHWRNKADNAITVYRYTPNINRDGYEPNYKVGIFVQKIRFKEVGKVGSCDLRFDPDDSNYYEVSAFSD